MFDYNKPFLLCVDDDRDILRQLQVYLGDLYNVITAENGQHALQILASIKPSVILLDVMMPDMDGYHLCSLLQENPDTAWIPVIFISALGEEQDRAKAFAAGAVDYLVKPVQRQTVRDLVETHQHTGRRWAETKKISDNKSPVLRPSGPIQEYLCDYLALTGNARDQMIVARDWEIYPLAKELGISSLDIAQGFACYKAVPYIEFLRTDAIKLGALPTPFSRANNALVIEHQGRDTLVVSDPFDLALQDALAAVLEPQVLSNIAVTDPDNIAMFFEKEQAPYLADRIVVLAFRRGIEEIRIDALDNGYSVRFLEEGDLIELTRLKLDLGQRLIARYRVLAGIALAERIKNADGIYAHPVGKKSAQLRLSVFNTPHGDSMLIRIVDVF